MYFPLLRLHIGVDWLQCPVGKQVAVPDPTRLYPEPHEKKIVVSYGYIPFTGDLLAFT